MLLLIYFPGVLYAFSPRRNLHASFSLSTSVHVAPSLNNKKKTGDVLRPVPVRRREQLRRVREH
jgi:ribosomal protein L14